MIGALSLIMLSLFLINAVVMIFTAYVKLPYLEAQLSNSKIIQDSKTSLNSSGIIGRLMRQVIVWDAIRHWEKYHEQGLIDKADIAKIPKNPWLWLDISQRACGYIVLAMIPFYITVNLLR